MIHMNPKLRAGQRGTSLIEMMASLVILAVGILGVMQMSILSANQNGVAVRDSAASFAARDMVDAMERMTFDHPAFAVPPGTTQTITIWDKSTNTLKSEWGSATPLLGATAPIVTADIKTGNLAGIDLITWTITANADGTAKVVDVLVRLAMPAGRTRDIHAFTVKYSPAKMLGVADASKLTEI